MTGKEQKAAAKAFSDFWKDKGYEKGESQAFWLSLLRDVYGVEHSEQYISFENQVKLDHTSFIDGYIEKTHVMIEQKSLGKDLRKGIPQSDGSLLSPFQQAKRYAAELPYSQRPRWIITCNFAEFLVYDMEKPNGEPEQILLKNLPEEFYRLQFLVDTGNHDFEKEQQISVDAGKITKKLYEALLSQYQNPNSPESLKSLNMLCVRLVFCFYADKANIFRHNQFRNYLHDIPVNKWNRELKDLFRIFDTEEKYRDQYEDDLNAFPYVNGGLFADEHIEIPRFTEEIANIILNEASVFEWQNISPTIFGAIFESTLNPETRRSGGMHYTSLENIHKVIDPLFLDELKTELNEIKTVKIEKTRREKLRNFRKKLSSLVFLDPACGSGNFLTETYISLRRLENEALFAETHGQMLLGREDLIQVNISQFYGIEINDFAVTVAKTALWIAESQMMQETEQLMQVNLEFLPLKSYANITEGNALRLNWESVVPKEKLCYIMGNPPFSGARLMNQAQKKDVMDIFDGVKNNGNLDYVSCWYKKSADMMTGMAIRTALVSTNSITQGEQVAILWKYLFAHGVHIDFAYKTFIWDNEANQKAHVHCVIVGFSKAPNTAQKRIFDNGVEKIVENINGYLIDAENVFILRNVKPLCDVPEMYLGGQALDNGNLILTIEEKENLLSKEPQAEKFIRPYMMGKDFIQRKPRYCIWLVNANPAKLKKCPIILKRIEAVREFRLKSKRQSTLKSAETPTLFAEIKESKSKYVALPKVSSENRRYIPIDYLPAEIIPGDKLFVIENAEIYHFGVLASNVHMAWMRAVCGRLKSDYSYSNTVVYNNFPWCNPTPKQKQKIEQTAQAILNARAKYPDCSLADLYDETTMPPELRKAHQLNDFAVMQAYGFDKKITESECVAELMKLYQQLTEQKK